MARVRYRHRTRCFLLLVAAAATVVFVATPDCVWAQAGAPDGRRVVGVEAGTWRAATVFTHAAWRDLLFFGGGAGADGGDARHEMEIGVIRLGEDGAPFGAARLDAGNPVIRRDAFGLDRKGRGLTPLSILEVGQTLYMFCTARPGDDLSPRIVVITASVDDPLTWSDLRVVIDASVSGCDNNHGASALVDPDDPTRVLVYFAARTPPAEYRILLASVPIDELTQRDRYTLIRSYDEPVLMRDGAKTNYPFVRYDAARRVYELWYSGHTRPGSRTRSCFVTTSPRKDAFAPAATPIVTPSERPDRDDHAYATGPKVHRGWLYYSGRRDARGPYRAIFAMPASQARR